MAEGEGEPFGDFEESSIAPPPLPSQEEEAQGLPQEPYPEENPFEDEEFTFQSSGIHPEAAAEDLPPPAPPAEPTLQDQPSLLPEPPKELPQLHPPENLPGAIQIRLPGSSAAGGRATGREGSVKKVAFELELQEEEGLGDDAPQISSLHSDAPSASKIPPPPPSSASRARNEYDEDGGTFRLLDDVNFLPVSAQRLGKSLNNTLIALLTIFLVFHICESILGIEMTPAGPDLILLFLGWYSKELSRIGGLEIYYKLSIASIVIDIADIASSIVYISSSPRIPNWAIVPLVLLFLFEQPLKVASILRARVLRRHLISLQRSQFAEE